ncbi:MAG: beta-hydroxyacyl-ACP dehydratase [Candidatus Binatia bacterium]
MAESLLQTVAAPERDAILAAVPQQRPFRFVDEIVEVSDDHIVGRYRFREDEFFYRGHFPGDPITPGVILIEAMAQTGVVALGLHLAARAGADAHRLTTVFTESNVEFSGLVRPGDVVTTRARKVYFRRMKLKVAAEMTLANGSTVCSGELAGMGVQL